MSLVAAILDLWSSATNLSPTPDSQSKAGISPVSSFQYGGITTRLRAQKQINQLNDGVKHVVFGTNESGPQIEAQSKTSRRPLKFLKGTSIPNSTINAAAHDPIPTPKDKATKKKERDEFVAGILERLQVNTLPVKTDEEEEDDKAAVKKIQEELERRSVVSAIADSMTKKTVASTIETLKSTINKSDEVKQWEEINLKEKRRVSRRTAALTPLNGERRSTVASIKEAIQNSQVIQQLLNADNIELIKIKQIQTGASIMPEELALNFTNDDTSGSSSSAAAKPGKARRPSNRKSSTGEKFTVKKKTMHSRKGRKSVS